ncbi:MAG: late competence development ComFB family protein [Eubacteriales bacterium]|nr:late competence development ComFB family protein [Eubacteriales bacterium]
MPKKSNKTEHVLNLISKNDEAIDQEDLQAEETTVEEKTTIAPEEVEVSLKPQEEEKELKIERKLKIELEPEIGIKPAAEDEPELLIQIPQEAMEQAPAQPSLQEVDEASWPHLPIEEKRVYLVNLSEKLALEMVDEVMERLNVCTCPICKNDILALALNSLTHNYVTTDAGRQYMLLDVYRKQYETDVVAALTKACVRVKAAPKH